MYPARATLTREPCAVQLELKKVVAMVLSRMHVTLDPQRMRGYNTVEDYTADNIYRVTLQRPTPAWLRMRPHVL